MEGLVGAEVENAGEVAETAGAEAENVGAEAENAGEVAETAGVEAETAGAEAEPERSFGDVQEPPAPAASPGAATAIQARPPYRLVRAVSVDVALPDQFPTVTLEDAEDAEDAEDRHDPLRFRIGMAEGVALAHALAGTAAPRPLTHDLFALALERLGVEILAVRLTGRIGATYFAELDLLGPTGREVLSCRPSDGICLALRQRLPAPVLCDGRLFAVAGDVLPDEREGLPQPDPLGPTGAGEPSGTSEPPGTSEPTDPG